MCHLSLFNLQLTIGQNIDSLAPSKFIYVISHIAGLKVGWITQAIWVAWVTFWRVKWAQTKLSGCDLDITCSLETDVGIW